MFNDVNVADVLNIIIIAGGALLMYILRGLRQTLDKLAETDQKLCDKLQKLEIRLASEYVRETRLQKDIDNVFREIRALSERLVKIEEK